LLREAAKLGINHIDTSDFYGPHVHEPADPRGAPSLPR
jgi:aryl-alcohol dehydrogenase-like predicted oxidoreductase